MLNAKGSVGIAASARVGTGALEAIYARLPEMQCRGLCQESCGPIGMAAVEASAIRSKHGALPVAGSDLTCSALANGRCSIYADRPLICRLWGVVERMACPWGCVPEGGRITDAEAYAALSAVEALSPGEPYFSLPSLTA